MGVEQIVLTGLIRHSDKVAVQNLLNMYQCFSARTVTLIYWDYLKVKAIPSTRGQEVRKPMDDSFVGDLESFDWLRLISKKPVTVESCLVFEHPKILTLGLRPNPEASASWCTALDNASQNLRDSGHTGGSWMITRPDFYSSRYFMKITNLFLKRFEMPKDTILVAKRPYPHLVLESETGVFNLPIDHFWIGASDANDLFVGLSTFVHNVIRGSDQRQPCVNEFIIGQFLLDRKVNIVEFPLPYLIRRNTWRESITPSGRNRVERSLSFIRNAKFQISLVFALHKAIVFPNTVYKEKI